jgi:hypothetical protein
MDETAILVPVYKDKLDSFEELSFNRLISIFNKTVILIVAPTDLNIDKSLLIDPMIKVKRFDSHFFKSVTSYSRLLTSIEFYKEFSDYKYILIHQLDCYLFNNNIEHFVNQGFDYIGAPWIKGVKRTAFRLAPTYFLKSLIKNNLYKFVGNGGLSLRNIQTSINVLEKVKFKFENFPGNEDYFWSFYVPERYKKFKIADFDTALSFSFETDPRKCLELNNGNLPFGCHGWQKELEFWSPFINMAR